jgi:hypothetical protein
MSIRPVALALAAAGLAFVVSMPGTASAAPGLAAKPEAGTALLQEAGYYKRRWRYRYRDDDYVHHETWVAAPFARVYSGRDGTWVRAPFVNLWVPR